MFAIMATRPTTVPIMPKAGDASPIERQTFSEDVLRSRTPLIFLERLCFTTSGLLPSINIWTPSSRNSSEILIFSRAKRPSLRLTVASWTISSMSDWGSSLELEKVLATTFSELKKCPSEKRIITPSMVPDKTKMGENRSSVNSGS